MVPYNLGEKPNFSGPLEAWNEVVHEVSSMISDRISGTAFLTVDQREILPGITHRRPGVHFDGVWIPEINAHRTGGGRHRTDNSLDKSGIILVSDYSMCRGWNGVFEGNPGPGGDCEPLRDALEASESFMIDHNEVFWGNAMFIHEGLQASVPVKRTLMRISLPADAPCLN
jgi:hypothetical protein